MNRKFVNFVASAYLAIRKVFSSRFLYEKFAEKHESDGTWNKVKDYPVHKFSDFINTYKYLPDPGNGLFDYSHPEDNPDYFFSDLTKGRDCDNWSRLWLCYLKYHNDEWEDVKEIVVLDTTTLANCFNTSHFITVAKNKATGKWHCFNYDYSNRKHGTMEEAILEVCSWQCYEPETLYWKEY